MQHKKRIYWGDMLIFLAIASVAAGIFLTTFSLGVSAQYAEIYQDGTLIRRVRLAEGYQEKITISGDKVTNILEIDGRKLRFYESDCYDKVCVHAGWLSMPGQVAVCLPNRVILKVAGEEKGGVDILVQ